LRDHSALVQNGAMDDWDDLRHFLAVAETGSTLAAGRQLRVSQTTAARRVAALEERLGLRLFDRRQAGYQLTSDGAALIDSAQHVALATATFEEMAAARRRDSEGTVRITTSEIYAVALLAPMLRDYHEANPSVRIEFDTSDSIRDLDAGAADIALRIAVQPTGAGLVGRRLGDDDWTVYCSRDYAARHGIPRTIAQLAKHPIIGGGEQGVWESYRQWLRDCGLEGAISMQHNTSMGLLTAARSGFGVAALPCLVADRDPDLIRCLRPPVSGRGVWLLAHERRRHEPRLRALLDFIAARFGAMLRAPAGQVETPTT
jgi:DNA-binding transcriptional LysR family regulator